MRTRKHPEGKRNRETLWLDAKGVKRKYTIHPPHLGRLVADGEVRTVSLREPGGRRGKRLYEVAGIERLLERRASNQPS